MTKNTYITGGTTLVLALTLAVIGRYAGYGAEILRLDVLTGFVVVATLIALITLEYGVGSTRPAIRQVASLTQGEFAQAGGKIVPLVRNDEDERAAA